MANQELVQQIMDLMSQLSPEDMAALMEQMESVKPEEEAQPPQGIISPEAGPKGVPA